MAVFNNSKLEHPGKSPLVWLLGHCAAASIASFEGPLVLPPHFLLFLRCVVVLDVEGGADLVRSLPLHHVCDGLASQVQQRLDVQVVCSLKKKSDIIAKHLLP
jgi:hypothetical protein